MRRSRRQTDGATWAGSALDRELLRELAIERFGVDLPAPRRTALAARLRARIDAHHLGTLGDYYRWLRRAPDGVEEWGLFADAMTCEDSHLFSGSRQLDDLVALLPELGRKGRPVRVLSAGCASGEEAFGVGAVLAAHPHLLPDGFQVVGVDVSTPRLARACAGRIAATAARRVAAGVALDRWFERDGDALAVRDELRRTVNFHVANLAAPGGLGLGRFDVIFCRNVLVDAHDSGRPRIVASLAASLERDGSLFIGETETLEPRPAPFRPRGPGRHHAYVHA
jgi:chemotaxis protein methyltransferase CheR